MATEEGCSWKGFCLIFFFWVGLYRESTRCNLFVVSCSSDVRICNCGETQNLHVAEQPFRDFIAFGAPRNVLNVSNVVRRSTEY